MWNIDFPNGRNKFFSFPKLLDFTKLLILSNLSIIILLVNYLGNWLIFQIRNLWNFLNWTFLGGIRNIEWSNVERPGFRNLQITNIKITKDELFFIYEFILSFSKQNCKIKKNSYSFIWKIIKFPKFKNLENSKKFYDSQKLSSTLSVQVI